MSYEIKNRPDISNGADDIYGEIKKENRFENTMNKLYVAPPETEPYDGWGSFQEYARAHSMFDAVNTRAIKSIEIQRSVGNTWMAISNRGDLYNYIDDTMELRCIIIFMDNSYTIYSMVPQEMVGFADEYTREKRKQEILALESWCPENP